MILQKEELFGEVRVKFFTFFKKCDIIVYVREFVQTYIFII